MLTFIISIVSIFFIIGVIASTVGIVSYGFLVSEKLQNRVKERDRRWKQLFVAIDRIESNSRTKPNRG
jgi:hypothetical protein